MEKINKFIGDKKIHIVTSAFAVALLSICLLSFPQKTSNEFNNLIVTKNPVVGFTGVSIEVQKSFAKDEVLINYTPLTEVETGNTTQITKNENYEKPKKTKEEQNTTTTNIKTSKSPKERTVTYDPSLTIENSGYIVEKELGEQGLTFYCACKKCCGKDPSSKYYGLTATGTTATEGRTIAVDPRYIPYGSKVFIDGFGLFTAEDCGGSIKNARIDVFVTTHNGALILGKKTAKAYIVS